jgi:hypothetical protein
VPSSAFVLVIAGFVIQAAVSPPSMVKSEPVMNAASSEAR